MTLPMRSYRDRSLLSVVRRVRVILREDGWLALWFRVLGETVYRRVLLLRLDLPPKPVVPVGVSAHWLRAEEVRKYAEFHPRLTVLQTEQRLGSGQRCLVLESGERFVHSRWIGFQQVWIDYLGVHFPLPDRTAYVYESYTPPELRGNGYATTGALAGGHLLHQEGYERVISCIQPDKTQVYPPNFKAGYRPVGYFGWVRLGPWRFLFRRSANRFPRYAPIPWQERPASKGSGHAAATLRLQGE